MLIKEWHCMFDIYAQMKYVYPIPLKQMIGPIDPADIRTVLLWFRPFVALSRPATKIRELGTVYGQRCAAILGFRAHAVRHDDRHGPQDT